MKFALFLGRVFLINAAAGVGAATGVAAVVAGAHVVIKKASGKTFTEGLVEAIDKTVNEEPAK